MHMCTYSYCKCKLTASVTIPHAPAPWEAFTSVVHAQLLSFVGGQNMLKTIPKRYKAHDLHLNRTHSIFQLPATGQKHLQCTRFYYSFLSFSPGKRGDKKTSKKVHPLKKTNTKHQPQMSQFCLVNILTYTSSKVSNKLEPHSHSTQNTSKKSEKICLSGHSTKTTKPRLQHLSELQTLTVPCYFCQSYRVLQTDIQR